MKGSFESNIGSGDPWAERMGLEDDREKKGVLNQMRNERPAQEVADERALFEARLAENVARARERVLAAAPQSGNENGHEAALAHARTLVEQDPELGPVFNQLKAEVRVLMKMGNTSEAETKLAAMNKMIQSKLQ